MVVVPLLDSQAASAPLVSLVGEAVCSITLDLAGQLLTIIKDLPRDFLDSSLLVASPETLLSHRLASTLAASHRLVSTLLHEDRMLCIMDYVTFAL